MRSARTISGALILLLLAGVEALRMSSLNIPQHVVLNQTVRMVCDFNLDQERLYSVKWYKDGHEFYRYVPEETPDVHVFPLPGVFVDEHSSYQSTVVLNRVNRESSGRYRCEVSGEAPAFETVSDHADMMVVVLPEHGPNITVSKQKYQAGDTVRVNCTSAPSKPPAVLMWFVNEKQADRKYLRGPHIIKEANGLETSQLGLEFQVKLQHFQHGDMKLKCLATISSVYKRSKERSVSGIQGFFKQPMESRETRAQSHTRSEPATGSETRATATVTILSILSIFVVRLFTR